MTEGSRLVPERLSLAEKKINDGNLPEAWRYVRLAIERLYTITYIKYGPTTFRPDSWQDQTTEHMWNSGVGDIVLEKDKEAGNKLKEIIDMAVAGGHDTPPRGETDLRGSIQYLRQLLSVLRVGG